jgi:monoamine oxidase
MPDGSIVLLEHLKLSLMKRTFSRRAFIRLSALSAGALALRPVPILALRNRPLPRKGSRKKVLVVGAGLAGLSAAFELVRAGHDVTVLEAQMRAGGRVQTLRAPFSEGLYAEAGAGRIPDNHHLTLQYIEEFGLQLAPFYPTEGDFVNLLRGRRIRQKPGKSLDLSE